MKTRALFLGLSLLSSSVLANEYNAQVDVNYATIDSFDIINVSGTYYLDKVTTDNTAWAEAAFMGKKSSISAAYTYFNGNAGALAIRGDYYRNNFFAALDVVYTDIDGASSETNFAGEVGYFFAKDWLVAVSGSDEDFSDSLVVRTKYIATLNNGAFVNVEASYINDDSDIAAAADYYWTAKSSVGLSLSTQDSYDFGVKAQHFFSPTISARVEYISFDFDNLVSVGITGRF